MHDKVVIAERDCIYHRSLLEKLNENTDEEEAHKAA